MRVLVCVRRVISPALLRHVPGGVVQVLRHAVFPLLPAAGAVLRKRIFPLPGHPSRIVVGIQRVVPGRVGLPYDMPLFVVGVGALRPAVRGHPRQAVHGVVSVAPFRHSPGPPVMRQVSPAVIFRVPLPAVGACHAYKVLICIIGACDSLRRPVFRYLRGQRGQAFIHDAALSVPPERLHPARRVRHPYQAVEVVVLVGIAAAAVLFPLPCTVVADGAPEVVIVVMHRVPLAVRRAGYVVQAVVGKMHAARRRLCMGLPPRPVIGIRVLIPRRAGCRARPPFGTSSR